ncbi:MAG: YggS family pyridoxal phosphate-dependent enzyme [Cyanobacteria bacterium P01_F01_bin.150]
MDSGTRHSLISEIDHRLTSIRPTIPDDVTLIAISKKQSSEAIRAAYALGLRHFGESRIQEAILKQEQLEDLSDITWHFIGHLQSNKAAKALERFHWIHSVHSLKLAKRLNQLLGQAREAGQMSPVPKLCLQVKMVPDKNKSGWDITDLANDLPTLANLSHLDIDGLMTIPPLGQSDAAILEIFTQAQTLATKIQAQAFPNISMRQLSMGMSGDYPLAIQAGATMVRIGRTIFGDRSP